jgi:hypothetical protein
LAEVGEDKIQLGCFFGAADIHAPKIKKPDGVAPIRFPWSWVGGVTLFFRMEVNHSKTMHLEVV